MLIPLQNSHAKIMETIVSENNRCVGLYNTRLYDFSPALYTNNTLMFFFYILFRLFHHKREEREPRYS